MPKPESTVKMMTCDCGDFELKQNRWYNKCITESVRMICRECNKTLRVLYERASP